MRMDAVKKTQWLATGVLGVTVLSLAGLLGRVVWLQKHVTPELTEKVERQSTAHEAIMPETGAIHFADGAPAALSVRKYNLFADPAYILDKSGVLNGLKDEEVDQAKDLLVEALAPLVNKPKDELLFRIESNGTFEKRGANGELVEEPRRVLWLAKEVDEDFYNRFMELKKSLDDESRSEAKIAAHTKDPAERAAAMEKSRVLYHTLDGVNFVKSMKRVYPMGQLAGNVVGFANPNGGVDGLEHQFDFLTHGIDGSMDVTKDASRHTLLIQDQHYTAPDDGRDVWLTLNSVMQGIAEDELKKAVDNGGAEGGTAIIMDPYNGHILAIANYPFFDPSDYRTVDLKAARDKAVTDPFEPGSIFKPFVMAWALEKHVVVPGDVFFGFNGVFHDRVGRTVKDDAGYGALTVHDILVKSSNIGMTQIGWKMGIPLLHEAVVTFGFGSRTGVELPGDQKGIVPPLNKWGSGELTSASFGYGIAATPLQLLRGFATFANGGYLVTPRVIGAVEEEKGTTVPWSEVAGVPIQKQIISAQTCAIMRGFMVDVLGPTGTAKNKQSKIYKMYGKTGTAHIAAVGDGGHGYGATAYNSSFLCGAPVDHPRLVLIVTLHKPNVKIAYFGGTVSAPAAVAIMERALEYLQVVPDQVAAVAAPVAGGRRVLH